VFSQLFVLRALVVFGEFRCGSWLPVELTFVGSLWFGVLRRFFQVDDSAQLWHIYVNAERSVCNTK
jgi:hypothetical protein